jgi:hypothetical protein
MDPGEGTSTGITRENRSSTTPALEPTPTPANPGTSDGQVRDREKAQAAKSRWALKKELKTTLKELRLKQRKANRLARAYSEATNMDLEAEEWAQYFARAEGASRTRRAQKRAQTTARDSEGAQGSSLAQESAPTVPQSGELAPTVTVTVESAPEQQETPMEETEQDPLRNLYQAMNECIEGREISSDEPTVSQPVDQAEESPEQVADRVSRMQLQNANEVNDIDIDNFD